MPRYTLRRLHKLPSTEEGLRRYTVLNTPDMLEVHIPPAVPYSMKTLGTSDWVCVVVQGVVSR